ncbi:hypothetical protein G9A89_018116 [Geosiphon pyriformis]|nr:hypothetical protein G9A89_018116 [Geosiphon pyriformis]
MPLTETYMALGSTFNWAEETEQEIFEESRRWKKVRYSTLEPWKQPPYIPLKCKDCNKKLSSMGASIALINRATQEDVCQIKEAEYIDIPLPEENDENEIKFGVFELVEKLPTIPIYLLEKQPPLQLKYFDNHGQGIRPEKAHKIDAGYDLRYPEKDTLVLQSKSLTKINLKIALKILPGAMVQIAFRSSLASKGINIRGEVIDAGYTGDITIMLQNETDKSFKIEHAEKITQAIYLLLINISSLQLVNNREQLRKSERGTQSFGSTK